MPAYKITANASSQGSSMTRKARCTVATIQNAILRLLTRYPQLETHTSLTIVVSIDDEEDINTP